MSCGQIIGLGLTGHNELFMDDSSRKEEKSPRIYDIPRSEIDDFPDHPFQVKLDEDMDQLVESICANGVITPATLRKKENIMRICDTASHTCQESGSTEEPPDIDTYDDLVEITDVQIDMSLSRAERMQSYIRQIKDPYKYRCNGIVVTVAFADTDATIEDRLEEYIRQRQANNQRNR